MIQYSTMKAGGDGMKKTEQSAKTKRKIILLMLLWLLTGLACNLPIYKTTPTPDTREAVRQTLAARLFPTPQATKEPIPGQPTAVPATPELPIVPPESIPATSVPELRPVTPGVPASTLEGNTYRYITQPGDTTEALAMRFGVAPEQVLDPALFPAQYLLPAGLMLSIPNALGDAGFFGPLMPDSEIVDSPAGADFSLESYVQSTGGYLSTYTENIDGKDLSGAQVIQRVADETSISPRILLAFLEYRSRWVLGRPQEIQPSLYPIGFQAGGYSGLYKEITLVARQLTIGYYGWRSGKTVQLAFVDGTSQHINPTVNAGTAAVQYLFSTLYKPAQWQDELYGSNRFLALYKEMFGDPWLRAAALGALLPDNLAQPPLELPFPPGEQWSFTGGPHAAWGVGSIWGGLDFAPVTPTTKGCSTATAWATAAAAGLVTRSDYAQVIIDLDGDGNEQTGWVLLYLHIATEGRVAPGTWLNLNDRVGHPSCEGGFATGTHVHIARKYNGEWIGADGPVPFVLSGWRATYGARVYEGILTKGDQIVSARPDGSHASSIKR